MDLDGILHVCSYLGLTHRREQTSERGGTSIVIQCPLSAWKHSDATKEAKYPATQIWVNDFGQSEAKCYSSNCGFTGSFYYLIWKAIHFLPKPTEGDLKFVQWVNEQERDDVEALSVRVAERAFEIGKRETSFSGHVADMRFGKAMLLPADVFKREDELLDEVYLDQFHNGIPVYVTTRGVKVETAKRWGLRYDKRLQRVVFPVRRMDGKLVGCSGRIIPAFDVPNFQGDHPLRYYNYSGLNKMRYLYGAHLFKLGKPVVITEGQFDVLKTSQALGEDVNACATLGHGFSENHRKTIASVQPDVIYLFQDDDAAGKASAEMIATKVASIAQVCLMRPTGGKDPGSMTDDAIRLAFASAVPVLGSHLVW